MPNKPSYELPLYRLFQRLKGDRFPLGVDQYEWALKALQYGRGIQSIEALRNLCKTLWLNHQDNEWTFDFQFDQVMAEFLAEEEERIQEEKNLSVESQGDISPKTSPSPNSEDKISVAQDSKQQLSKLEIRKYSPGNISQVNMSVADQANLFHQSTHQTRSFILSSKHTPISARQMKQSWRYLRVLERVGAKTEINLSGTIKQVAKTGSFISPQMQPPLLNQVDLKLLIDWEGSMIPFHSLARQLIHTSVLDHPLTSIHYFHDVPGKNLYLDPYKEKSIDRQAWLRNCDPRRSRVLVFSDGGAARKSYSTSRIERTITFLKEVRENCKYIAWLNPMPISRWAETSAAKIQQMVPMFEATRTGMDDAIDALRGKVYK